MSMVFVVYLKHRVKSTKSGFLADFGYWYGGFCDLHPKNCAMGVYAPPIGTPHKLYLWGTPKIYLPFPLGGALLRPPPDGLPVPLGQPPPFPWPRPLPVDPPPLPLLPPPLLISISLPDYRRLHHPPAQ
jgi:hypothetical protein